MFSFIALAWAHTERPPLEKVISTAIGRQSRWRTAWDRPGLAVYVSGEAAQGNRCHRLAHDQGVALGTLFEHVSGRAVAGEDGRQAGLPITTRQASGLLSRYWGRYVGFISKVDGGTEIVRDPSGSLPCMVLRVGGLWIVFSWLEDILGVLPEQHWPRVDEVAIRARLLLGVLGGERTALEGVDQVLPGQSLLLVGDSRHAQLHWNAVKLAARPSTLSIASARDLLASTVHGCVRAWTEGRDGIVLRLSGGIDSSILAGCLSRTEAVSRTSCLNYFIADSNGDERRYARRTAAFNGLPLIERPCDDTFDLQRVWTCARTPSPESYMGRMATMSQDIDVARSVGASAMFTGAGGDAAFYEFRRWWPAADYLHDRGFDGGFPSAVLAAARLGKLSFWRVLRLAMQSQRAESEQCLRPGRRSAVIHPDGLLRSTELEGWVHPAMLEPGGLPIGKLVQVQNLLLPIPYYDPFHPVESPEIVNPLLSQPVVELALSLPSYVLTHGGTGRSLARLAFRGSLHDDVVSRHSKGGMNTLVQAVLRRQIAFVRERLLDGELVRRGLVRRDALASVLSNKPSAQETPVSEIHTLLCIEAWLNRWTSPARCAQGLPEAKR